MRRGGTCRCWSHACKRFFNFAANSTLNTNPDNAQIPFLNPKGYVLQALTQWTQGKATPALTPILSTCGESSSQREARTQQLAEIWGILQQAVELLSMTLMLIQTLTLLFPMRA